MAATPAPSSSGPEVLPLTRAQAGLWYAQQLQPDNPVFVIGQYLEVDGRADPDVYRRACGQAVTETDALRLRFEEGEDGPVQVVTTDEDFDFAAVDVSREADPREAALAWMRSDMAKPVDPGADPMLSVAMITVGDELSFCYQRVHHLALDGYGAVLVMARILQLYAAFAAEEPVPDESFTPLRDLVDDDAVYPESDRFAADRDFWLDLLGDRPDPTLLAGRPSGMPYHLRRASTELAADVTTGLRGAASEAGVSLSALTIAAVAAYLSRATGDDDVVLSLPVTARRGKTAKQVPGMVSNIIPLRLRVGPDTCMHDLAGEVSGQVRKALLHQRYRPEHIRSDVGLGVDARLSGPAINILPPQGGLTVGDLPARLHNLSVGPVDDLSIVVSDPGDGTLQVDVDANPELYAEAELHAHLQRFENVLTDVAAGRDTAVGALEVATAADHATVSEFARGPAEETLQRTIHDLFAAQVLRSPNAIALVAGDFRLSFAELDRYTNQAAREFISHEVGPGRTVAVALPRSGDLIISLLAIAKAGGAYVPVDPSYPDERIHYLLDDAQPNCVVTDRATAQRLPAGTPTLVVDDHGQLDRLAAGTDEEISPRRAAPGDPAYVIYTSGSTGNPKGVVVEHASLANLFAHQYAEVFAPAVAFVGGRRLRIAHTSAVSFDASWDPLLWMLDGHELHFVDDDTRRDPEALVDHLRAARIDSIETTPSYASQLLTAGLLAEHEGSEPVRVVSLGGEAVGDALWQRLADASGVLAFNFFGPTESTVNSVVARMGRHDRPVIGRPVHNTRAYVLDSGLAPMPVGRAGELYLAGAGLARTYLRQPERTAERFVPDPYGPPGSRMYRTGDLARWTRDGMLEFAGRVDDQVKLRGFRVELGEIDAVLAEHPDVADVASVVRSGDEGVGRLVTYVVPRQGRDVEPDTLRDHAADRVPEHMVPALFVPLDQLPLTPNGKLDQRALPAPETAGALAAGGGSRAPRTPQEELLAGLFAQALGLPQVGADDDFFELGGHSLLATRLVSRIRSTFGAELPIRALFEAPTVAGLARRLEDAERGRPQLRAMPRPDRLPLSFAQRRLWFLNQLDTAGAAYHIPAVLRLTGELDIAALRGALADVVARHETLRTLFPAPGGEPYQRILGPTHPAVGTATDLPVVATTEDELPGRVDEVVSRGFDLSAEVPVRGTLFALDHRTHVLCLVLHHVAGDGWSLGPLARDLTRAYTAHTAGSDVIPSPPPVQYADYSLWQQELLGSEDDPSSAVSEQLGYWSAQLAGLPEELALPTDRPRPATAGAEGGAVDVELAPAVRDRIAALAREHGASVFMVLQAAFAALLSRFGAGDDVPLGSPIAGRTDEALDELVGFFVNTLVLRTDVSGDPSFAELVDRVRETDLQAYAHQDVPFERLVEELTPERSLARHPLFQVMLSFQNAPEPDLGLPGVDVSVDRASTAIGAKFDLDLDLGERTDDTGRTVVAGSLNYSADLFDRATVADLAARFEHFVDAVTAAPAERIGRVALLTTAERDRVLVELADGGRGAAGSTVLESFAEQVAATPDATALVAGDETLTFADLAARAHAVAHELTAHGATGTPVAVALPRSADSVVALVGVLEAGAVYLPVDLEYPAGRIAQMLDDARPSCAITDPGSPVAVPGGTVELHLPPHGSDAGPGIAVDHADAAYLLYTSGSTGTPKGVAVDHGSLANLLAHHREALFSPTADRLGRRARVAHTTAVSFDASWDPLLWMLAGHELHLVDDDTRRDPEALVGLLRREGIDAVETTPSYVTALLDTGLLDGPAHPTVLAVGGEAVTPTLWERLRAAGGITALNYYGPTEACVDAVTADLRSSASPVIGTPVAGTRAYVLDRYLEPLPTGAPGELYLAGCGVARGYAGQPVRTAESFVPDPHGPAGARMYRTGDLARWNRDGALEFIGRTDDQVKVRGFRVELGDIEAALLDHPDVGRAAPLVDTDPAGAGRLVAYLVAAAGHTIDPDTVREHAASRLPGYMVPTAMTVLDDLPLTVNGKLDRTALPAPEPTSTHRGRAAATTAESALCRLFGDVLGVTDVGPEDNFFDLGGHSLVATRLISRIRTELDTELPIRALFEEPTVAGLAARLDGAGAARPSLGAAARPAELPLSFAQRRLWFLNRLERSGAAYHIPAVVRLSGELDVEALRGAVGDLVARHETLRTVLPDRDGEPRQEILDPGDADPGLPVTDARGWTGTDVDAAVQRIAAEPFDLATQPSLRVALLTRGEREHLLVLVVHHVAADGWSMGPLTRDLSALYRARRDGADADLAALPVQYADYALWQRELLGAEDAPDSVLARQLGYWSSQLAELPGELTLPTDRPRPAESSYRGGEVPVRLDARVHRALDEFARARNASVFMVLQAAFAALLSRFGAGDDVPLGSPIAGRTDEALDELVGFFVNTLVLRTDVSGDPSFAELVDRVRETDLQAYAHQDVPFERLVEELTPERSLARHPLFQVMLTLNPAAGAGLELPGVDATVSPVEVGGAKFDLSLSMTERVGEDGLDGTLEYSGDLFDRATADDLAGHLVAMVEQLLADPEAPIGRIGLLTAAERDRVLGEQARGGPAATGSTVLESFAEQVDTTPDTTAVVAGDETLTFGELATRARRLAHFLRADGVAPGRTVGVALPRSAESLVALLGVLEAGAVYLPIDLEHPAGRIEQIVGDAAPARVLTVGDAAGRLPEGTAVTVLDEPTTAAALADSPTGPPEDGPRPADAAYLLYTSGSTGRPKGVVVEHGSLANLLAHHRQSMFGPAAEHLGRRVRVAHTTAVSFDASWDPVLWMLAGHELHLVDDDTRRDPEALVELLHRDGIDAVETTPTYVAALLEYGLLDGPAHPTLLALGGEAVSPALWSRLQAVDGVRAVNLYGPTEACVDAVVAEVHDSERPVIGAPVAGARSYVLDRWLEPMPVGAPGELYLAGAGLARGYTGQPGMTAERFVADPHGPAGSRMYRTGDLARWTRGGDLDFAGRVDDQVKVRGFRVELGEIEAALLAHPGVARAAPLVDTDASGAERLLAYVVGEPGHEPEVQEIRRTVARRLPDYMVPTALTVLDDLPRTVNGKLDRAALPAPDPAADGESPPPRTPQETVLADLFAEVLGAARVGIDDSFFELGGHSLLATRLIGRIRTALDVDLPIRALFEAPTVAGLAERLETGGEGGSLDALLPLRTRGDAPPLFAVHPAGGLAWPYAGLLRHLPSGQPLFGLQVRGIAEGETLPDDPDRIIEDYVARIRSVAPRGPYRLLGWSFGGELAHHIAARLQARGETVDALVLLDSYPASTAESAAPPDGEGSALFEAYLGAHGFAVEDADRPLDADTVQAILRREGSPLAALDAGTLDALVQAFSRAGRVLRDRAPDLVAGDVDFVTATRTAPDHDPAHRRWEPHVTGTVRDHPVDAAHTALLSPEALTAVGPIVAAALAGSDTDHQTGS